MKINPSILAFCCVLVMQSMAFVPFASAQTLLLQLGFDDDSYSGTTTGTPAPTATQATANQGAINLQMQADSKYATFVTSAGAFTNLRSVGTGVGGVGHSFDNSGSSGMGSGFTGGRVNQNRVSGVLPSLNSFTITGWYNAASNPVGTSAYLTANNAADAFKLSFESASGMRLTVKDQGGTVQTATSASDSFSTSGSWVFYAVTVDFSLSGSEVSFYQGSLGSSISSAGTANLGGTSLTAAISGLQVLGNSTSYNNPFDGQMDDFRIYSGALSSAQLDAIRLQAVPEPSSSVLVLAAVGAMVVFVRRRY